MKPPAIVLTTLSLLLTAVPHRASVIPVGDGCTLIGALASAERDAALGTGPARERGDDVIRLTGDLRIEAGSEVPVIAGAITILAPGVTVTGETPGPLFEIAAGGRVRIEGLSLVGRSIVNRGVLELVHVSIDGNGEGAAIVNSGTVTLIDTAVRHSVGAGIESLGGKIRIVNSDISGNAGHGVEAVQSDLTIVSNSTINDNAGTGVMAIQASDLTVLHSTLARNGEDGLSAIDMPPARVISSTLSGNAATGAAAVSAELRLVASTLSGNTRGVFGLLDFDYVLRNTTVAGNGIGVEGAQYVDNGIALRDSIIAGNLSRDCASDVIQDLGGNLDGDGSCAGASPMSGLDPVLTDNGGPTATHALLPGSAALDLSPGCPLAADQRGVLRDGLCDSGAYELATPAMTLDSTAACPGPMTFTVEGAAPGAEVALIHAPLPGGSPIPRGTCSGTITGLRKPRRLATGAADGAGAIEFGIDVLDRLCGQTLQAVDLSGCTLSHLTPVGRPPVL